MDDLIQEFIAETRETLDALAGEIIAWEAAPADRARLDAIFRFVHTVKGSCGFLDLPRLARLSHAAEDVLAEVRDGRRVPDRALVDAVLAIVDRIGELVEAIDAGTALDDSGEELLIAALAGGSAALPVPHMAEPGIASAPRVAQRSVRLNVDLLDRMMGGMSDMVLARNELARRMRDLHLDPALEAALDRLSSSVAEMRDTVTRTRMQKIDSLFSALPRMVRDTAATLGKSVTLLVDGSDVELDREMIEVMRDPLVHIVRNAIDHGIEAPAARRALGKRENGVLRVSARQSGNQIVIEVADDGRGIDIDRLSHKVVASGIRTDAEVRALGAAARAALVFEPGLSSRDEVTEISGRGVGMDVVRAAIDAIGGRIDLDNAPGRGLRIVIQVPLTLSIISAIIVGVGPHRFAIPRQAIAEIVTERGDKIRIDQAGGAALVSVRGRRMPLVDLSALLGAERTATPGASMLAIVGIGAGQYAIAVDSVVDNEELVVKPAAPAVMAAGVYAGQTLPDNGRPMLLLDCTGIAQAAGLRFDRVVQPADDAEASAEEEAGTPALLFRDLDARTRVIPLAVVDRIERTPTSAIRRVAGRLLLAIDDRLVPIEAVVDPFGVEEVAVLRLTDGVDEVAYAAQDASDIVSLPDRIAPAMHPGPIAGAVLLGGEQVEVIDPHWLFARAGAMPGEDAADARPLCLLDGPAGSWLSTFVRPMLEGAGYRVTTRLDRGEVAAVVLTEAPAGIDPAAATGTPVIRLRAQRSAAPGDDSIFRYDRPALEAALARRMEGMVR